MNEIWFWIWMSMTMLIETKTHSDKSEGASCDWGDNKWYCVSDDPHSFLFCDDQTKVFHKDQCATINGIHKIFNESKQQCVLPEEIKDVVNFVDGVQNDAKRSVIGDICFTDFNCPANGYCDRNGICQCKRNHFRKHNQCIPKVDVEDAGCKEDTQCTSMWPGANCVAGTCKCPPGSQSVSTPDGVLCGRPDSCPIGEGSVHLTGSENCHSDCHLNETHLGHLFYCAQTAASSRCCPNKALTCMQPAMAGNGNLNVKRFFYNPIEGKCLSFRYRGGSLVNSNVFNTFHQCESYCNIGCPRGSPLMQGKQEMSCKNENDCPALYTCNKRMKNAKLGNCCPKPAWLCSPEGGVLNQNSESSTEFDSGSTPRRDKSVFYPVIRYYFSATQGKCRGFLYKGEGGNFNNFLTEEHCKDFCSASMCNGVQPARDSTGRLIPCSVKQPSACPSNYICSPSAICCPLPTLLHKTTTSAPSTTTTPEVIKSMPSNYQFRPYMPSCPLGSEPLYMMGHTTGFTSPIMPCDLRDPCPSSYTCELSFNQITSFPRGICCKRFRQENTHRPVVKNRAANRVQTTTVTLPTTTTSPRSSDVFCSLDRSVLIKNAQPTECSLSNIICGTKHVCSFLSVNHTTGFCCPAPSIDSYRCPALMSAVVRASKVSMCSPYDLDACPEGAWCVFDEMFGTYHCCQHDSQGCPAGMVRWGGGQQLCDPHKEYDCPAGYECQYSHQDSAFRCCGFPASCPAYRVAFMDPVSGIAAKCSKMSNCPPGFSCVLDKENTNGFCCSTEIPELQRTELNTCIHGEALVDEAGDPVECSNLKCPTGFHCTEGRVAPLCCPKPSHVCPLPIESGEACARSKVTTRFAFDWKTKTCKAFMHQGCAGNDNAFHTLQECDSFCHINVEDFAAICPHGVPLEDSVKGGSLNCNETHECPGEWQCMHTTHGNYCCPGIREVCAESMDAGVYCSGGVSRSIWYFDEANSKCTKFHFHGCGGNLNRFDDERQCYNFCSQDLCPHGRALLTDKRVIHKCNSNATSSNDITSNSLDPVTSLTCPTGSICVNHSTGVNTCCKEKRVICSQPNDPGTPCGVPHYRYSYNWALNKCVKFLYLGCDGTENNFINEDHCNDFCKTEPINCKSGTPAYIPIGQTIPQSCIPSYFSSHVESPSQSCPSRFSCQETSPTAFHCCPQADVETACPYGSGAFAHAASRDALTCDGNNSQCPFGFQCTYNTEYATNYCCSHPFVASNTIITNNLLHPKNSNGGKCSDMSKPFVESNTRDVRICSPYLTFSCPVKHVCQYNTEMVRYQCCPVAPIHAMQSQYGSIQPAYPTSPKGMQCPSGLRAYLHPSTGAPIICQPGVAGFCPFTSMCQYSTMYWQFICCSNVLMAAPLYDISHWPTENAETKPSLRVYELGEKGCTADWQCSAAHFMAYCLHSQCLCPYPMSIHNKRCVSRCPGEYVRVGRLCAHINTVRW